MKMNELGSFFAIRVGMCFVDKRGDIFVVDRTVSSKIVQLVNGKPENKDVHWFEFHNMEDYDDWRKHHSFQFQGLNYEIIHFPGVDNPD